MRRRRCRLRSRIRGSPGGRPFRHSRGRKCWRRSCGRCCSGTGGANLYDLAHALEVFEGLDTDRIVEMFGQYLALSGQAISRAQAQARMFAKLANPRFLLDVRPLLPAARAETLTEDSTAEAFRRVFMTLVDRLPGEPWGEDTGYEAKVRYFVVRECRWSRLVGGTPHPDPESRRFARVASADTCGLGVDLGSPKAVVSEKREHIRATMAGGGGCRRHECEHHRGDVGGAIADVRRRASS